MNSRYERETIQRVKHVTGRTFWDYSLMKNINPKVIYHRCNYNLRHQFYQAKKWAIDTIYRHSIITGHALMPLKGLHILVKALAVVKQSYPDVMLTVPGGKTRDGAMVPTGYLRYIDNLVHQYGLKDNIRFVGPQGPEAVIDGFLHAHVAVVPSAIEGASATLCEAMFLGVPSIASFRGGMTELLRDKESGFFYDYPEYPMLAERIMELFSNDALAVRFSQAVILDAEKRHDREQNPRDMISVYSLIMKEDADAKTHAVN